PPNAHASDPANPCAKPANLRHATHRGGVAEKRSPARPQVHRPPHESRRSVWSPEGRYRVQTTDSHHDHPIAPNRLAQGPKATAPNQLWVADITYIETQEGWLYLAAILDLYSRKIVGWAMSERID